MATKIKKLFVIGKPKARADKEAELLDKGLSMEAAKAEAYATFPAPTPIDPDWTDVKAWRSWAQEYIQLGFMANSCLGQAIPATDEKRRFFARVEKHYHDKCREQFRSGGKSEKALNNWVFSLSAEESEALRQRVQKVPAEKRTEVALVAMQEALRAAAEVSEGSEGSEG